MRLFFSFLLLALTAHATTITCHYTCDSCSSEIYSNCTSCPNNQELSYILNSSPFNQGTCSSITTSNFNSVGIILFIAAIVSAVLFFNEEIIYLVLFIQSLGLLYLVEVNWQPALDYTFAGLTYLMIFTKIGYSYKQDPVPNTNTEILKGRLFFKQFEMLSNFSTVGLANLIIVLAIVFAVVFKSIRKKCVKERATTVPDWVLDKIILGFSTTFLFLIQQSTACLFFSIKYGTFEASSIVLMVFYFIALILFTVNQFFYPLSFFRGKFIQCSTIISKCLTPLFLLFPPQVNYLAFIFLIIAWTIDLVAANKNQKIKQFNRLLAFKIVNLVCLSVLTLYYILEIIEHNQNVSKGFGIISIIAVYISLHLIGVEIVYHLKKKCETVNEVKENAIKSSDYSENKQVTLQNLKMEGQLHSKYTEQKLDINFQNIEVIKAEKKTIPGGFSQKKSEKVSKISENKSEQMDKEVPLVINSNFKETSSISIRPHSNREEENSFSLKSQENKSQRKMETSKKQEKVDREQPEEGGKEQEDKQIQMTQSKVPMVGQTKKKHKKSKRKSNSNQ